MRGNRDLLKPLKQWGLSDYKDLWQESHADGSPGAQGTAMRLSLLEMNMSSGERTSSLGLWDSWDSPSPSCHLSTAGVAGGWGQLSRMLFSCFCLWLPLPLPVVHLSLYVSSSSSQKTRVVLVCCLDCGLVAVHQVGGLILGPVSILAIVRKSHGTCLVTYGKSYWFVPF